MAQLKEDGLLEQNATKEDFIKLFKETMGVGEEGVAECEGFLIPKQGKNDTLDFFDEL
jgi:hypothetical protein